MLNGHFWIVPFCALKAPKRAIIEHGGGRLCCSLFGKEDLL